MARTIENIQAEIIEQVRITGLSPLNGSSKTSVLRLFIYVIAVCQWTLEQVFDRHKQEVTDLIARMKPHSLQWYAQKARQFQYGFSLPPDSDTYDNTDIPDDQVAASKIISYCAVVEQIDSRDTRGATVLRIKTATMNGDLTALNADQLSAFTAYMNRIKDAGVRLWVDSKVADDLRLSLTVYYDPLVLSSTGARLDGLAPQPVQDTITAFLSNLPFNGLFVPGSLTDALQRIDGVIMPQITGASARYGNEPFKSFEMAYQPDAGYLRFAAVNTDLTITFKTQSNMVK